MRFHEKISLLASRKGLTQDTLGVAMGVAQSTVARWLKGAVPRPAVTAQLADYFGVSVDDLLDDTRELPAEVLPPPRGPASEALIVQESTPAEVSQGQTQSVARRRPPLDYLSPDQFAELVKTLQAAAANPILVQAAAALPDIQRQLAALAKQMEAFAKVLPTLETKLTPEQKEKIAIESKFRIAAAAGPVFREAIKKKLGEK